MSDAKKLIENKEKYDNRFERKIQNKLNDNLGLGGIPDKIDDMDSLALEEPEEYFDWMVEENREKMQDVESQWEDTRYTIEWLFDNGYLKPTRYNIVMSDVEWIDDAFSYDNYFDLTGTLKSRVEMFLDFLETDELELVRDREQRTDNMKRLQEIKKKRELDKQRKEEMKEFARQRMKDGGSRKTVDVDSHIRKTQSGRPTKVRHHRRSRPKR